jgi:hypothetical protein
VYEFYLLGLVENGDLMALEIYHYLANPEDLWQFLMKSGICMKPC